MSKGICWGSQLAFVGAVSHVCLDYLFLNWNVLFEGYSNLKSVSSMLLEIRVILTLTLFVIMCYVVWV